ncbi:acyl-CoA thioester hydrolase [Thermoactinomyces sp. DSM 45891]|uniref:acyl-CoA thioesterase n=1 Tax=Thermoactinomyces sp. DSM 45891 TaxID=1761907 RepID=UPI0009225E08|nr:thioesterase family protein [Thermoactinomyces sp. DSM 45891]SFX59596.1 acyl-CoA thioester hydrolase [Thermoactinomyces sp. DSM 45891]
MNASNYVSQSSIQVRYQETDQMGVVYHSNYLVWFEIGRTAYTHDLGYSYRELEKLGVMLPLIEVKANYRAPARYDDEVIVYTTCTEASGSRLIFEYEIKRKRDQVLLTTGHSIHVWVNKEMKRVNMKEKFPDLYATLVASATQKRT